VATARPTLFQYIAYSYGRRLPDSMQHWVAHDLAGEGAVRRHMIRAAIPPLLVLAPFWLLPASLYVHSEMTAPIYIWTVLMSFALNKVWRRHRLAQHNLDPNLVDAIKRKKDAHIHQDYIRRYGPRPESAKVAVQQQPLLAPNRYFYLATFAMILRAISVASSLIPNAQAHVSTVTLESAVNAC
jgi:Family of unknown function (DUF5313)